MGGIQIAGIELVTFELERALHFYTDGLGFTRRTVERSNDGYIALLTLGEAVLRLWRPLNPGAIYPQPMRANDPWFQHFAVAVADPVAACEQVLSAGGRAISEDGPMLLPPSSGSVTAWKFRDPDGHPLELSAYPNDPRSAATSKSLFLALDHTAVATSDLQKSVSFYEGLGFEQSGRGLNEGPTQAQLDGLHGPVVDIVVLRGKAEPHLELLHYRTPPPVPPRLVEDADLAATRTLLSDLSGPTRDPDGHRLQPV